MNFDPRIAEALSRLPDYLGNHVLVSATALGLGLLISLPLAFAAALRPGLRMPLIAVTSVVQTIPGLALLALFYPLLLGLSALTERIFGAGFSALGFLPAVLALTLYSMLPITRNTLAGLFAVDPAIREAAQGVGMTPRQSLFMVELPIAFPIIMAGIRTAAVWVIGTATLSTPIGQTSLGNYIFTGLQTQNWVFVLFGCVAAAVFALVVERLLALIERGADERRRKPIVIGLAGLAIILAASLAPVLARPAATYTVGAKTFAEQYVLAALIRDRLTAAGLTASRRDGLGSAVIFNALVAGDIDVYVEYSGTLWTNQMGRRDVRPREEVLAELEKWLSQRKVRMLGGLGFENAYALAMPRAKAQAIGVRSIADLAAHAPRLSIAGDYEFFARPEWAALREAYGLRFRAERQMQPDFMYQAAAAGDVDVVSAYTSEGLVAKYDLVILDDPKRAIPPYDAILLVAPKRAGDEKLAAALMPLVNSIDVEKMRAANLRATTTSPEEVARWLAGEIRR